MQSVHIRCNIKLKTKKKREKNDQLGMRTRRPRAKKGEQSEIAVKWIAHRTQMTTVFHFIISNGFWYVCPISKRSSFLSSLHRANAWMSSVQLVFALYLLVYTNAHIARIESRPKNSRETSKHAQCTHKTFFLVLLHLNWKIFAHEKTLV